MSLPPTLFPTPSTAGIVDTHSGDRVVASSRRPDGTYRKELKIRPGFTPEEDVKRFRAARMAESDARAAVKGRVPGLTPGAAATTQVQAALAGMTKAQKKNANRKKKRAEGGGADGEGDDEEVPDEWDDGEETATASTQPIALTKPTPTIAMATAGKGSEESWRKAPIESANKSSESTPTSTSATATPAPAPPTTTTMTPPPQAEGPKVRALKKKLRQAEQLKERETMGLYLPPTERAKIKGIPDLEDELRKLTVSEPGSGDV